MSENNIVTGAQLNFASHKIVKLAALRPNSISVDGNMLKLRFKDSTDEVVVELASELKKKLAKDLQEK